MPPDPKNQLGAPARDPGLPPAERRRRRRELWLGIGVVSVLAGLVIAYPLAGLGHDEGDSGLFLLLNSVMVIGILILGFLVTRNFWKLVGERRRGTLGSHLHLKFVSAFVLIALGTTSGVFIVSAVSITRSIDRWFSVQVDGALEKSGEVASAYYASIGDRAVLFGRRIAEEIAARGLLDAQRRTELAALVQRRRTDWELGDVEVYDARGRALIGVDSPANGGVAPVPGIRSHRDGKVESEPDVGELVAAALAGEALWRVGSRLDGDLVRGAVPVRGGPVVRGAVVVDRPLPLALTQNVRSIHAALDEYRALRPSEGQLHTAYVLQLLLASVGILMLAWWMGFRLAKGVTGPIRALAKGTTEVARGNLDVVVETRAHDEVGFLVDSFNSMTQDLREARLRIERSNAELEQRRRSMEVVLANVGAGVVSIDADGRVRTMNAAAQRFLGVPEGAGVIGARIGDVVSRSEFLDLIAELAEGLRPGPREHVRRQMQVRLDDELATLFVTTTRLRDESGASLGTVIVIDDHTQVVKMQRMAAWREVARRIAHEIKNPLTPIQLSAQRIRRRFREKLGHTTEDLKVFDECVDTITSQVESLKLLVDEFSNFARLPAANPEPGDLNRIVRDAVASYSGTEHVDFATDLDESLPSVDLDREQMRRVLTNLIDNAIAAVHSRGASNGDDGRGRVGLRSVYEPSLQTVRLEVSDDGIGIPAADRRRIFEPYFSTKHHGTGLGLAIVSRIVADHRGYVRVQDNDPAGSRFIVDLPVRGV